MLIRSSADRRGAGGAEGAKERINTEERSSGDERSWFFDRLGWRVRRGLPEQIVDGLIVVELRSVTTHCQSTRQVLPIRTRGSTTARTISTLRYSAQLRFSAPLC